MIHVPRPGGDCAAIEPARQPGAGHAGALRQRLFLHQDGFVLSMILGALEQRNICTLFLEGRQFTVGELARRVSGNVAYLHVSLRCLSQQGWLRRRGEAGTNGLTYQLTESGRRSAPAFVVYQRVSRLIRSAFPFEDSIFEQSSGPALDEFSSLVRLATTGWDLAEILPDLGREVLYQHLTHLDGALVVASISALWRLGCLDRDQLPPPAKEGFRQMRVFLDHLGLYDDAGDQWSESGKAAREYLLHYGMVGSSPPHVRPSS